jgi:excisionase family DNA binding protein
MLKEDKMGIDNLPTITTVQDLAKILRVSDQTILRAIWRRELAALKVGKVWRIERKEVIRWIKNK